MKKASKITIKHYLNKRIKPETINGEDFYCLYYYVTINRKTTHRRSNIENVTEKDFLNSKKIQKQIQDEANVVYTVMCMYQFDIENNVLKHKYRFLSMLGVGFYNAADSTINEVNAYLNFYTCSACYIFRQTLAGVLELFIYDRIIKNIDFSMYDKRAIMPIDLDMKSIFNNNSTDIDINTLSKFVYKNASPLKDNFNAFFVLYELSKKGCMYQFAIINLINDSAFKFFRKAAPSVKLDVFEQNKIIINNEFIEKCIDIIKKGISFNDICSNFVNNKGIFDAPDFLRNEYIKKIARLSI